MSKKYTSQAFQADWQKITAMRDRDIDLSDIPEITHDQIAGA